MSLTDGQRAALLIRAAVEASAMPQRKALLHLLGGISAAVDGPSLVGEAEAAHLMLALADRLEAQDAAPPETEPESPPVFKRGDRVRLVEAFGGMEPQDTVVLEGQRASNRCVVAYAHGWRIKDINLEPLDGHDRYWWVPASLLVHL